MSLFPEYDATAGFHPRHVESFKQVSIELRMVIASRELNPLCTDLMMEGYAAKGFHIKAKTCDWGPMAGFVALDPRFTKASQSLAKQEAAVLQAVAAGVGAVPLVISASRLSTLFARGVIERSVSGAASAASASLVEVTARQGGAGDTRSFFLVPTEGTAKWSVWYRPDAPLPPALARARLAKDLPVGRTALDALAAKGCEPLYGLTNPRAAGRAVRDRDAVCGDYDLWCVFPHASLASPGVNDRPMPRATFVSPKIGGAVRQLAHQAALVFANDAERQRIAAAMGDPHLGNISFAVDRIRRRLNAVCRPGNDVVMHGDYGGFALGEIDYPLIFFIPHAASGFRRAEHRVAASQPELQRLLRDIRRDGFRVEANPAWALPSWR
ncbi:MAG TPA: anthrax toxin-like adenylyl cyclase domain-containing protein [Trinickia sp.]|uniref:anthrax toxin-like adenylyl cyclase domain-containing protein n=2 Tax=Trinickia sp. TaxID=2571163 RepID=UPI002F41640A